MNHFDLIVLGTGGVGSAALYHAAKRGLNCLGLDRFPPAHDKGSSHGESRLIRLSYFEHPDYVPLLYRSYELWDELDPGLLNRCGILYSGQADGPIIGGVLASARKYELDVAVVDPADVPQYRIPAACGPISIRQLSPARSTVGAKRWFPGNRMARGSASKRTAVATAPTPW